jgi:exosortase A
MTLAPLWKNALIRLLAAILTILAIFYRDVIDMVAIWWNISTYTHCLFIIPIVGWLVGQRWSEVEKLRPAGFAPGLFLIALGGLIWLLGQMAGISIFRHAGLVFMIQSTIVTLLGLQVARGLLFPLFYLSFLVPFGEELVPVLQTITAKLSMIFLEWAGIPAHIEGVFITTPTGLFEVAEACSGIKFLVAMLAYGALVANVCFTSITRRIAFMAVSIIIPIIANGIRAYGTIHLAKIRGLEFAESIDHIVWGWFFFAAVLALVMAIGWKFFDHKLDDPWLGEWASRRTKVLKPAGWLLVAGTIGIILLPVVWQTAAASWGRKPMDHAVMLPDVPGWQRAKFAQKYPWQPRFDNADHSLFGEYVNASGQRIALSIALFAWQGEGRELVGYGQGAFDQGSNWSWANDASAPIGGAAVRIFAPGVAREVVSFYRIGGLTTGNPNTVKFETLKGKLLGRDQAAAAILISAEESPATPARAAIDAFITDLGSIATAADQYVAEARGQ